MARHTLDVPGGVLTFFCVVGAQAALETTLLSQHRDSTATREQVREQLQLLLQIQLRYFPCEQQHDVDKNR